MATKVYSYYAITVLCVPQLLLSKCIQQGYIDALREECFTVLLNAVFLCCFYVAIRGN